VWNVDATTPAGSKSSSTSNRTSAAENSNRSDSITPFAMRVTGNQTIIRMFLKLCACQDVLASAFYLYKQSGIGRSVMVRTTRSWNVAAAAENAFDDLQRLVRQGEMRSSA